MPERETMTAQDLAQVVADSVSERFDSAVGRLDGRLDELEARLDSVAGRAQLDGVSERLDVLSGSSREGLASLSARVEEATLQAGELVPVEEIGEIGPVIIELVGDLLELWDSDGDGASDLATVVTDIREQVFDISDMLIHPALSTPFTSYSVTEALLLMIVLFHFLKLWLGILRSGFWWMR